MDKYFTIKKGSRLYIDYFQWKEDLKIIRELFNELATKYGIEATSFVPRKTQLLIVPTAKDDDNFYKQFTQAYHDNGLRQFKCNSDIGKDWTRLVRDTAIPYKPNFFLYIGVSGRYHERLFSINDVLYGSLSAECRFELHECMSEIKASEFYKIIEEFES